MSLLSSPSSLLLPPYSSPHTFFLLASYYYLRDRWTSLNGLNIGSTPYHLLLIPLFSRQLPILHTLPLLSLPLLPTPIRIPLALTLLRFLFSAPSPLAFFSDPSPLAFFSDPSPLALFSDPSPLALFSDPSPLALFSAPYPLALTLATLVFELTTSIGPAFAIPAVLTKAGISKDDVDFYEINEAFASQAVMSIQHLHLPYEKVCLSYSPPSPAIAATVSCR